MISTKKRYKNAFFITAICSLVYFVSYFARKDFAISMAGMIEAGVIDKDAGGLIGTALFITYGIGQLVSGYLGDKIKPGIIICFGLGVTCAANAVFPFVKDQYMMIPVWAVNGFAQAMLWPPIVRILAGALDHNAFVKANLCVTSAAHISTVLLYAYVPLCLSVADWKTVFYTAAGVSLAVLVLFTVLMWHMLTAPTKYPNQRNIKRKKAKSAKGGEPFLKIAHGAGLIPIFVSIVAMGFLRDGIESWLPTLYNEVVGGTAAASTLLSSILPIFAILSIAIITALHKTRLFKNEVLGAMIIFIACIALALPLPFIMKHESSLLRGTCLIISALITACMHGINFLLISCLPGRFVKTGRTSTASGITNAFVYVGAAISSYALPAISTRFDWSASALSWIIVSAIGVIFALLAIRRYTAFIKE